MREILFRGKRVDNGEWVYGGFYRGVLPETNNSFSIDNARIKTIIISNGTYYHVEPETVGQYTGLKDQNGVKIFEGDIFSYKGREVVNGKQAFPIRTRIIKNFIRDTSILLNIIECSSNPSIEVIRNIHDNPELLEELAE